MTVEVSSFSAASAQLLALAAGGPEEAATLRLEVGGMACAACAASVEAALRGVHGVLEASVSLLTSQAEARHTQDHRASCVLVGGCSGDDSDSYCVPRAPCQAGCLRGAPPGLQVRYSPGIVGPRTLLQAVSDAGFAARPASEEHADGSALREREKQV